MLLSWIIPLYNCGRYIGRCIESLRQQDIEQDDYEIIIVDDESTDNSYSVASSYQNLYSNITLIQQKHRGPGEARNLGLKISTGEFVCFVDADDMIRSNAIGSIFRQINNNGYTGYDIIGFTHRNFTDISQIKPILLNDCTIGIKRFIMYDFCCTYGFRANVCNYVLRKSFISYHNLSFGSWTLGEDLMFMLDVYARKNAIILYTAIPVYYYFQRLDSISNCYTTEHLLMSMDAFCNIHQKLTESQALNTYPKEIVSACSRSFAQYQAMTTLLAAGFPMTELKMRYKKAEESKLFPITDHSGCVQLLLATLSHYPSLIYLLSYLYRLVYVPFFRNRRLMR